MSSGMFALIARRSTSGVSRVSHRKLATCARAWTPASVRPLAITRTPGPDDPLQGLLQRALDRWQPGLDLPARIRGPVIRQSHSITGHALHSAVLVDPLFSHFDRVAAVSIDVRSAGQAAGTRRTDPCAKQSAPRKGPVCSRHAASRGYRASATLSTSKSKVSSV